MAYQYVNTKPLHLGSMDVRVLDYGVAGNESDAVSIGVLDGVYFTLTGNQTIIENDNSEDIDLGLSGQQVEIGASAWKNLDLEVLYKLLGKTGTYTATAGTAQTVTDEQTIVVANKAYRLKNKNGTGLPVTITQAQKGSTNLVAGTDYLLQTNQDGYTLMFFIGSTATAGSTIKISYTYTPNASKKLTYGSTIIPNNLHVWLINTDNNGKKFVIELYKVTAITGAQLSFGSDKGKALATMPISMIAKTDSTRPAGDDLFSQYDEQGV